MVLRTAVCVAALSAIAGGCGEAPPVQDAGADAETPDPDAQPGTLPAPTGVFASDTSPDFVRVIWDPVPGADAYRVYRDGDLIAEVIAVLYEDEDVAPGTFSAPIVTASAGTYTDHVAVAWNPPGPSADSIHDYAVSAYDDAGEGARSASDTGHRVGIWSSYEVSIDGGVFIDVGPVLSYVDSTAAPGVILPGAPSASDGTWSGGVELSIAPTVLTGPARSYVVRATGLSGGTTSSPATGYRGVGPAAYQWQRSVGVTDDAYADLAGGTAATLIDTTPPADGAVRYYRCKISAQGTAVATSMGDAGWAGVGGPIAAQLLAPSGTASTSQRFTWIGDAVATQHRLWIDGLFDQTFSAASLGCASGGVCTSPGVSLPDGASSQWFVHSSNASSGVWSSGLAFTVEAPEPISSIPIRDAWVTDGPVHAIAVGPDAVYLGGEFDYVGPPTGPFAALDATTAAVDTAFARPNGVVTAAIGDGSGGVFLCGDFSMVDEVSTGGLVHILPTGALDPTWTPGFSSGDCSMLTIGGTLYTNKGAVDIATGVPTGWSPGTGGIVGMTSIGNTIYLAGGFTSVGGQPRNLLAAVDALTGAVLPWNPNPSFSLAGCSIGSTVNVKKIGTDGTSVFVAGRFTTVGAFQRGGLAALDPTTGVATAWDPGLSGSCTGVFAMTVAGGRLYAGTAGVIGFDTSSGGGVVSAWTDGIVHAIAVDGGRVYVGGAFETVNGQPSRNLGAFDEVTGDFVPWSPAVTATVLFLAADAGTIYASGQFNSIGGVSRGSLAALDLVTLSPTAWDPGAPGIRVHSLAYSEDVVYIGGVFRTIAGQPRNGLAAVDASTGVATAWDPAPPAGDLGVWPTDVQAIVVHDGVVYAGGDFWSGFTPHGHLLSSDASTGTQVPGPGAGDTVRCLAAHGDTLFLGGDFAEHITAYDVVDDEYVSIPPANIELWSLAAGGELVYAGGAFSSIGGQPVRNGIAALDPATGLATSWDPGANGYVFALAVLDGVVYAGGSFHTLGGQPRDLLGAIDATGAATSWNPSANATGPLLDDYVWALAAGDGRIYAGGEFTEIGGMPRQGFAVFAP